ncbi:MAG: DegQ family serine endoprotease [Gammaproteobacteria bacterium]|nr:DegQ family serine endoprotease [Gammaproteobacteria bacterium]
MYRVALLAWLVLWLPFTALAALPAAVDGDNLPSLAPMLEQTTPAVVNISTRGVAKTRQSPLLSDPFFRRFFDLPRRPRERKTHSLGSGVVVDESRGFVVTNHHVIENAQEIIVTLRDGRRLDAILVGADPETDVAVIKIPPTDLTALKFADSDTHKVGDFVVAIGNPFGLGQTVTSGIISAVGRTGLGIEGYEDFIQTDASINPGNSGGALVNLRGELLGINTAILAPSGGNVGIGFAIPSNMVRQVMDHVVKYGEVRRGQLGVSVQDLTPALAAAFDIPAQQGAVVVEVERDSPAGKVGLQPGDIVVAMNDRPVRSAADLRNSVGLLGIGQAVRMDILRTGKPRTLTARIAEPSDSLMPGRRLHRSLDGAVFGLTPLSGDRREKAVMVKELEPSSAAWSTGLRKGDIISHVNRQKVADMDDLMRLVRGNRDNLTLHMRRGKSSVYIIIR